MGTSDVTTTPAAASPTDPPGDGAPPGRTSISRSRRIWVNVLIGVTTLLAVVGMLSVFANRLLFSPDNWENTSTQLLQNAAIRSATSNYLVDQLYANVDVEGFIKSALPPRLEPLAGPAAGALQNAAVSGVGLALQRPRVQNLWAKANRAADESLIAVVKGEKGSVNFNNGVVSLDLATILGNVASRFGVPPSVVAKLPPSVAHLTLFKSNQIKWIQKGGNAIQGLALWLTILVPLLYGLAIFLARGRRRRTLMTVGFSIVAAGLFGVAARHLVESQVTNALVADAALRPAVQAVLNIVTQLLGQIAGAFILVGAVVVVAAWFAGPARVAVACRRAIAPTMRDQPVRAFLVITLVMVLVFIIDPIPATGTPVGIIVFLALALFGTEMLRRQTAEEFPEARAGETMAAIRGRYHAFRGGRGQAPTSSTVPLTDELERLATLRGDGSITAEEYDAAKAKLLHA
jgi:hypothetical protein